MPTPPSNGKSKLTELERKFVLEHLKDGSGGPALIRAGSKAKDIFSASTMANRMLKRVEIQSEIAKARSEAEKPQFASIERIQQEYERLALYNPRKLFDENGNMIDIHKLGEDEAAAIAGFTFEEIGKKGYGVGTLKKIRLADKIRALDGYSKLRGFIKEENSVNQINKIEAVILVVQR